MKMYYNPGIFHKILARIMIATTGALALLATIASGNHDVVVYGATPGGIAAAVETGREGYDVSLYEPSAHIGGLTYSGLTNTDFRTFQGLGGAWKDFMDDVLDYYITTYGESSQQVDDCKIGAWYEPKVVLQVYETMLSDAGVTVFKQHELVSAQTTSDGSRSRITAMTTRRLADSTLVSTNGRVFIDASYEGDLAAAAGNRFALGRIMAYNFRITMSAEPDNQVPFADVKPVRYDDMDFSGLRTYLLNNPTLALAHLIKIRNAPNNKADFNDRQRVPYHATISGEGWCEGSFPYRQAMFDLGKTTAQAFFHFLATDEALAEHPIQTQAHGWGYAADEFVDTDNFPPALYVRQGRRIIGEHRVSSADLLAETGSDRAPAITDAVAVGDYNFSSHSDHNDYGLSVDDFLDPTVPTTNNWGTAVADANSGGSGTLPAYSIAYGAIVPSDVEGLLVPVALSADRTAYSSIRMEPTWAALGQAAGAAAVLALNENVAMRNVDITKLQLHLHDRGAITFYVSDVAPGTPYFKPVQYLGNRGLFQNTTLVGSSTTYKAPVSTSGTQWRGRAWTWHDVQPGLVLAEDVETYWRERYTAAFGDDALEGFDLSADGSLTRGEYLLGLYDHLELEPPVSVKYDAIRNNSVGKAHGVTPSVAGPRLATGPRALQVFIDDERTFTCVIFDLHGATVTKKQLRGSGQYTVAFEHRGAYVAVLYDTRNGGMVAKTRIMLCY